MTWRLGAFAERGEVSADSAAAGATAAAPARRCVTCGATVRGRFCADCGEQNIGERDYSIRHVLADAVAAFTNADSKIFRTMRTLVLDPGVLTAEFFRGRRKPYIAPLQLFLIANLLFFILQPFVGWDTFTTPLRTHLAAVPHKEIAQGMVAREVAERGTTEAELAREFDAAAEVHAKTLVIVMVPLFALLVTAAYATARRFYAAHLVFSLHLYAFVLLFELASIIVVDVILELFLTAGARFTNAAVDASFSLATLVMLAVYLFVALRVVYREGALATAIKAAVLAVGLGVVLQLYRFLLFFVTLYSI